MATTHASFRKPGYWGVCKDWVKRAIRRELHLPPWWLRDVGGSDFEATGREFLRLFIELGKLQPNERVLDIGCGSGRMALPLTGYLSPVGRYSGLDIVADSIDWCKQHITPRYPNFQFFYANLYNKRYNPNGRFLAREYVFPFEDKSFDFIFFTSVFTHLLPEDAEYYLRQTARLLRADGRAFITLFLLNDVQQALAAQGRSRIDFKYGPGPYRIRDEIVPETAVAYQEKFLRDLLPRCGLELAEPVYYGTWSGRDDGLSYQDILLVHPKCPLNYKDE